MAKDNLILNKSFDFSLLIIDLYKRLILNKEFILSKQLLRSGTSIGANIEEAVGSISKKEFTAKMGVSLKEARETRYWLKLLDKSNLVKENYTNELNRNRRDNKYTYCYCKNIARQ